MQLVKLEIKLNLKELVSNGKVVKFSRYLKGNLWYEHESGFEFPVPIDDIGDATFLATDKAMLFTRYIRKHLSDLENKDV